MENERLTPTERMGAADHFITQHYMVEMGSCPVCGHPDAESTYDGDKPDYDTLGMCKACADLGYAENRRQTAED